MIFSSANSLSHGPRERALTIARSVPQIPLPLLHSVTRSAPNLTGTTHPLILRTRDFLVYDLTFSAAEEAEGVWESLKGICGQVAQGGLPGTYAFFYGGERDRKGKGRAGWDVYEPEREFKRMGVGSRSKAWRFTKINHDYEVSAYYGDRLGRS